MKKICFSSIFETVTTSPQAVPSIPQFLHSKLPVKIFSNKKLRLHIEGQEVENCSEGKSFTKKIELI
jgi:hypothetical protein